jgi:hypothetical protein
MAPEEHALLKAHDDDRGTVAQGATMRPVDSRPLFSPLFSYAARSCALGLVSLLAACSSSAPPPGDDGNHSAAASDLSANARPAFDFLVAKGLADFQAAGIVGNLQQESDIDPTKYQYDGGPGRGIAQWSTGGRWDYDASDNVHWYAGQRNESEWSLQLQLEFIWYELPSFGLADLRASTNVDEATLVFMKEYEVCGQCDSTNRTHYAEEALAAFASGGGSPGGFNPCANVSGANNGTYCGSSTQSGFAGGPDVSPTTLYDCENGRVASTRSCSEGCQVAGAGMSDSCYGDPCTHVSAANGGLYCGKSTQSGFTGASSYVVYDCEGGRSASVQTCKWGCYVAGAGTNDGCNPDPCKNVSGANQGVYCGKSNQSGFAGGDPDTLYTCSNGATTQTRTCANGCYVAAAGQQDGCN